MAKTKWTPVIVKGEVVNLGENELKFYNYLKLNQGTCVRTEVFLKQPFNWTLNYLRVLKKDISEKLKGLERIESVSGIGYIMLLPEE